MDTAPDAPPDDIAALKEALASERAKALDIAAELAVAHAKTSEDSALIARQKLRIAKLERQIYGQRSERSSRLVDQLALTFEELEASATEDELAAERAVARTTTVRGFTRTRPERNTCPERWNRCRASGKWSRRCGRSLAAATARKSARRRHRSMPLQEAGLAQACWR